MLFSMHVVILHPRPNPQKTLEKNDQIFEPHHFRASATSKSTPKWIALQCYFLKSAFDDYILKITPHNATRITWPSSWIPPFEDNHHLQMHLQINIIQMPFFLPCIWRSFTQNQIYKIFFMKKIHHVLESIPNGGSSYAQVRVQIDFIGITCFLACIY